ncbi:hypothetical protein H310_03405 [Aphanomyces invadans]|uniref:Tetraspanin n=1 Tax=Aphanomyces invadans TaxID=157072 RepID=A0A024UGY1_9STRA|nr:hypothetical protein H310_03405 [Aphanomyces invadans]ETW05686.1 hypothetical protein H310_03405 [Aphanomyces invadans]|eukprot:XP_008865463.1 hypothetical protein H310_03405 [Aphanomyces invadans]
MMQTLAKAVVIFLNLGFFIGGSLLIYLGVVLRGGRWSDVFAAKNITSDGASESLVLLVLGAVVVLVACLGCAGAICANRCLLTLYSIFVGMAMLIFIGVAVLGFVAASGAKNWAATSYPAIAQEADIATGFNEVYCSAQGARFCTSATAKEAFTSFVPAAAPTITAVASEVGINVTEPTGVVGFCKNIDAKAVALGSLGAAFTAKLPKEYKSACDVCTAVNTKFGDDRAIFEWANEKCAMTPSTAIWCGSFLLATTSTGAYESSPYKQCRPVVIDVWRSFANQVAIGGVLLAVVSLVLVILACRLGRQTTDDYYVA